MANLTVRGLDDETHARLRVRAARNGRSMEAEVRTILHDVLADPAPSRGLGSRIHARFAAVDVELTQPQRRARARAATFDE